jgi:V/A-type H+/Na+-transporting ATPase subunit D
MAEIKLTKNELRLQQNRLSQLQKYLPTLQLKKAMLQIEVQEARAEIGKLEEDYTRMHTAALEFAPLLTLGTTLDLGQAAKIVEVRKSYENIAGVEVPYFHGVTFQQIDYDLFETPPWVDSVVAGLQGVSEAHVKVEIAREKKIALENELRQVSIRVNLFEKILIPRAQGNIKKIKVFLSDQQLAAVSRAKVAKTKILEKKQIDAARKNAAHLAVDPSENSYAL